MPFYINQSLSRLDDVLQAYLDKNDNVPLKELVNSLLDFTLILFIVNQPKYMISFQ